MVTDDDTAIVKEISRRLGLGTQIHTAAELFKETPGDGGLTPAVEAADGFARVFPEHKFQIVNALQSRGHIVGMTGHLQKRGYFRAPPRA